MVPGANQQAATGSRDFCPRAAAYNPSLNILVGEEPCLGVEIALKSLIVHWRNVKFLLDMRMIIAWSCH